jgi:type II secretory pathway pseudopilin PulG
MQARQRGGDAGYAMAALLVGMAIMAIMMTAAMPVWRTISLREREAELIFRGNQYGRAIAMFQRKYAGAFPPTVDVLVTEKFLRKKYKDPITGDDFQLVGAGAPMPGQGAAPGTGAQAGQRPGSTTATPAAGNTPAAGGALSRAASGLGGAPAGGIMGVASKSTAKSLALFNGRDKYNEWIFVGTQANTRAGTGAEGSQVPGAGRGGRGGAAPGAPRGGAPPGGGAGGPSRNGPGLPVRPTR